MFVADERNFRSAYYEKVGCKNVEERRSLEILLKEKIVDKNKLQQFCLRYVVPTAYRSLVWRICLGALSVHNDCHGFIMDQKKMEFSELYRSLFVMREVDINTPKPRILYAAFLLQSNAMKFHNTLHISKGFCEIVQFLMTYFKDDVELYMLSKAFYSFIHSFDNDFPKLVEAIHNLLEKEEPLLYKHLRFVDALDNLPYEACFNSCFAKFMNFPALAKIWDKLSGGSYTIFVYVFLALLVHFKYLFLECSTSKEVLENINKIKENDAEIIFNKAMYMWHNQGGNLAVYDKFKS
ncbi:hypothetical protein WA026_023788 [Henosepilachna vigintioctopunctata]|uniref:TBC1 domain family member 7 n=1 Tax=Henosepilachna vigintioctopunctata TaxID=420089 RepID=A0AAW1UW20_9CUCU